MECLDEEVVLALLDHTLEPARAGAVQGHLDVCAACRTLVAALARELPAPAEEPEEVERAREDAAPPPGSQAPGDDVGGFVVLRDLGEAPGGRVYLAHHRATGERVSLRALGPVEPTLRQALLREVAARASVRHPGLLPVHGLAERDGRLYLACAVAEGQPLAQWRQAHPGEAEARALFRSLSGALEALHAAGLVHGGLREEAIAVGRGGPLLLDGIPHRPDASPAGDWDELRALARRMGVRLERPGWADRLRALLLRRR